MGPKDSGLTGSDPWIGDTHYGNDTLLGQKTGCMTTHHHLSQVFLEDIALGLGRGQSILSSVLVVCVPSQIRMVDDGPQSGFSMCCLIR
jgi:hypothetical protein